MSTSDTSGFGQFVPGFEFMQNLARQATGGLAQGVQQALPHMPHLGNWMAPTFNVDDLEKRIQELKAVHFWLDQNARALSATIQALEVQKMTLATLQGMNLSLDDVANALKVKATDPMPPAQAAPPEASGATPAAAPGAVDPMQWWGELSKQFQAIAATALKDVGDVASAIPPVTKPTRKAAATSARVSAKTGAATPVATPGKTPATKATRQAAKAQSAPTAARKAAGRVR